MGIEEKDFATELPSEPSYKERVKMTKAERKRKHDEELAKLPPGLAPLAELAEELTEYYQFTADDGTT